jgi:hypothetical protein
VKTGSTFNLLCLFSVCLKNYVQGVSPQFLIPKYESDEIFENISFIQIKFSNLINYLTIVCQSGQGTMIIRINKVFDTWTNCYDRPIRVHHIFLTDPIGKYCIYSIYSMFMSPTVLHYLKSWRHKIIILLLVELLFVLSPSNYVVRDLEFQLLNCTHVPFSFSQISKLVALETLGPGMLSRLLEVLWLH